jgi:hypothetical protein
VVQPVAGTAAKIDPASAPATAGVSVGPASPSLPQPLSVTDIRRQLAENGSRWSARPADEPGLKTFSVRHPPGL